MRNREADIYNLSSVASMRLSNPLTGVCGDHPITRNNTPWRLGEHLRLLDIARRLLRSCVRFVMSKAWFAMSMCPSPSDTTPWLHSVVSNVREVVPGEIWEATTVTVAQGSIAAKEETFYVLEPTCEVIGRPPMPASLPETFPGTQRSLPIRADWSEYVTDRIIALAEAPEKRLLDCVQWANYEEYQNGISRHWLARTLSEGEVGELKKRVAEKYVLASVVENRYGIWTYESPNTDGPVISPLASAGRGGRSRRWRTSLSCPRNRTTERSGQR